MRFSTRHTHFIKWIQPRIHPALTFPLALLILALDWFTGPFVHFPVFFILPVGYSAWAGGARWGVPLAVGLSIARLGISLYLWFVPWSRAEIYLDAAIRTVLLVIFALVVARMATLARELRILRGFVPICCVCKKIRDSSGRWEQLEHYIETHSEAQFTHGFCPACAASQYGIDLSAPAHPGETGKEGSS